jgi:hypothetical protein
VRDDDGEIAGYFLPGHGFVDAASAEDAELVEAIRANPRLVIDETGALLTPEEWAARIAAGTAQTR